MANLGTQTEATAAVFFRIQLKVKASVLLFILVFGSPQLAIAHTPKPAFNAHFQTQFREILLDVRGSRGGNGDVAAGFLTAMALRYRFAFNGSYTFLVDEGARRILQTIARGDPEFWRQSRVLHLEELPTDGRYDLYLSLASPSGTFRYYRDIGFASPDAPLEMPTRPIVLKRGAVMVAQTVLGNTENPHSIRPHAIIQKNGRTYNMSPAGIGPNESGYYFDYIAGQLAEMDRSNREQFVRDRLHSIANPSVETAIDQILSGTKLKGCAVGLVYGVTAGSVRPQLHRYLSGLGTGESFCLITPSRFRPEVLDTPELQDRVEIVTDFGMLPSEASPGRVYVLPVPTLPHSVFIGLTAISDAQNVVPLGAGDGFLSAALTMGIPVALTQVSWNRRNAVNMSRRVSQIAAAGGHLHFMDTLKAVFEDVQLEHSQGLIGGRAHFQRLPKEVPEFSGRLVEAVSAVDMSQAVSDVKRQELAEWVTDPLLKMSIREGGEDATPPLAGSEQISLSAVINQYQKNIQNLGQPGVAEFIASLKSPLNAEAAIGFDKKAFYYLLNQQVILKGDMLKINSSPLTFNALIHQILNDIPLKNEPLLKFNLLTDQKGSCNNMLKKFNSF